MIHGLSPDIHLSLHLLLGFTNVIDPCEQEIKVFHNLIPPCLLLYIVFRHVVQEKLCLLRWFDWRRCEESE
jgi:hypothetical protein